MTDPQPTDPRRTDADAEDDSQTGLPGLRSWPSVYSLVIATFAIYVLFLTALSRAFQ